MPHRFDSPLQIDGYGNLAHARGPVADGEQMFWILALIWQNVAGNYAAAWGTGDWPNGKAPKWHCQTTMVGPNTFRVGTRERLGTRVGHGRRRQVPPLGRQRQPRLIPRAEASR